MESYFEASKFNGIDWNKALEEKADILKNKSVFNYNNRFSIYVSENPSEFDMLKSQGEKNVVFTDRINLEDTKPLEGSKSIHYVSTEGKSIPGKGFEIALRNFRCACLQCRMGNNQGCKFNDVVGPTQLFHILSKEKELQERKLSNERKRDELNRRAKDIIVHSSSKPLESLRRDDLKDILKFLGGKATRADQKNKYPLKDDLILALNQLGGWPKILDYFNSVN